jgi:dCMP deaminase
MTKRDIECHDCKGLGYIFNVNTPEYTDPHEPCVRCQCTGWLRSKEQPDFDTVLHNAQVALKHIGTGELRAGNIVREGPRTYEEGALFDAVLRNKRDNRSLKHKWTDEDEHSMSPTDGDIRKAHEIVKVHGMNDKSVNGIHEREPWHLVWMRVARTIAVRSYGERLKVGAIVVPDDNTGILALGYNGLAKGEAHVPDSDQPGKDGFLHAELNCITKLDFNNPKKKHMYVTHSPCRMCARLCINANISRVVYGEAYRDTSGLDILRAGGVEALDIKDLT